ncbi:helix-turn-helix domain-containing protein [Streptomyces sp. NPDC004539]|uniref:TetR/AcrR family transcriptional regulator n=1 Tax=Streptomyces sp. NPDC004539 TaxID=3154280 RepID=UPI0033A0C8A9
MTPARAPRADAVRNRKKILDAAREQITLNGPDAGMDEIAAAAGVAVGTLYRHFPTKTDLVAAVLAEYSGRIADDVEAARRRAAEGARALEEITGFLARVVEATATNHAVKAAAGTLGAHLDPDVELRARTALEELIAVAIADGDVHADVGVDDIYLLISTAPTSQPSAHRSRWLTLVLTGLTTHTRTGRA